MNLETSSFSADTFRFSRERLERHSPLISSAAFDGAFESPEDMLDAIAQFSEE